MRRRFAAAATLLVASAVLVSGPAAQATSVGPFHKVTIRGATYYTSDITSLSHYFPGGASPALKVARAVAKLCHSGAIGYYSATTHAFGLLATVPLSAIDCLAGVPGAPSGVSGGGPGGSTACVQAFITPAQPDPVGVSGGVRGRYAVLLAASNARGCTDMTTQAPRGLWGTLSAAQGSYPRGTVVVIKCQTYQGRWLVDLVSKPVSGAAPVSRAGIAVYDYYVGTGITARSPNVPPCTGNYKYLH